MPEPSFTVSIDRTSLSLSPLVMSGDPGVATAVSVIGYQEPAMQARVALAPASEVVHGDVALGWTWQQVLLNFQVATIGAESEAASRAALSELVAAMTQFSFTVTVTVNDSDPETWLCSPGSLVPEDDRTLVNLRNFDHAWTLSIPAYPIRST